MRGQASITWDLQAGCILLGNLEGSFALIIHFTTGSHPDTYFSYLLVKRLASQLPAQGRQHLLIALVSLVSTLSSHIEGEIAFRFTMWEFRCFVPAILRAVQPDECSAVERRTWACFLC